MTPIIIGVVALLTIVTLIRFFSIQVKMNRWRKQLERGSVVKFFLNGRFRLGKIKSFINDAQTLRVRCTVDGQTTNVIVQLKQCVKP